MKLTHLSKVSFLWDIGKQWSPRPDVTDQGLHCLLTERKWTGPIDKWELL